MKLHAKIITVLLLWCCYGSVAQTATKPKANYPYLLYLPADYGSTSTDFPLLIYLGGGSQRGSDLEKLKNYGVPYEIERGKRLDFIVAAPQCPADRYWTTENWFDSLYHVLTTTHRVDKSRIYVTGISIGGYGTWQVAMDFPDRIAAIVPLCGGVNDPEMVNLAKFKGVPIWTLHGTADDLIPIGETERVADALRGIGADITFTRLEGQGHDIQYLYGEDRLYEWLRKHRKGSS